MKKSKVLIALLLASVLSTPGSITAANTDLTVSEEDTLIGDSDFDVVPDDSSTPGNPSSPGGSPTTPGNPSSPGGSSTSGSETNKTSIVRKEVVLKNVYPNSNNSAALDSKVANSTVLYKSEKAGRTKIKFEVGRVGTFAFRIDSEGKVGYKLYSTANTVVSTAAIKDSSITDYRVLKKGVYILDVQHSDEVSIRGLYFKNKSSVIVKSYKPAKKKKYATVTLKLNKAIKGSRIVVKKNRYNPAGDWDSPLDVSSFSVVKSNAVFKGKVTSTKLKFKVKKNGVYTIINTLNDEKVKTVYTFKVSGLKK